MANTKVTGDVIANGTISTVHLADDAITAAKLDSTATGITFADLTVDTDTLYVDAANNRVGIGTTSPTQALHVDGIIYSVDSGIDGGEIRLANSGGGSNWYWAARTTGLNLGELGAADGRIFIANGGNVGINTTSPSQKLHIVHSSTSYALAETTGTGTSAGFRMKGSASADYTLFTTQGTNQFAIYDNAAGTERMRIDSSGNTTFINQVHIDSKPNSGLAYNVLIDIGSSGDGTIGYQTVDQLAANIGASSSSNWVKSGNNIYNTNSGNVGIGTTSPTMGLHIADTKGALFGSATVASTYISPTDENTINGGYGLDTDTADVWLNYRGYQDGFTRFRDTRIGNGKGSAIVMVDGSAGNVGIGTTSPAQSLDTTGKIRIRDGGNTTIPSIQMGPSGIDGLSLPTTNTVAFITNSTERMRITSAGNVGIGTTSPATKLHIKNAPNNSVCYVEDTTGYALVQLGNTGGGLYFGIDNSAGTGFLIGSGYSRHIYSTGTNDFHISTNASPRITINGSSGNVGIGTTSPDGPLHVVGKVNTNRIVSGNLIMGNIRSNLTTTTYLLLVDLNVSAGFSLVGELNAASYTTYNVSRIYVRKNYNATTGAAVITGIAKSGSNLSVVDISHSSGRFIAIKLTGDPEIDVMWTGYRLNDQFNSDGTIKILTSGVTENSVYASY